MSTTDTKNTADTANAANTAITNTTRETPDPNVVCTPADVPNRRPAYAPARQASTGVNGAAGDAETALLAGAP